MTRPYTNILPSRMSYDEMVDGYIALYGWLLQDRAIAIRVKNKLQYLKAPVYRTGYSNRDSLTILWRFIFRGILPGGPVRVWHFLSSFPFARPALWSTVVSDWITALSMGDFASRKLRPETAPSLSHDAVVARAE
jgi:hypothetical protein